MQNSNDEFQYESLHRPLIKGCRIAFDVYKQKHTRVPGEYFEIHERLLTSAVTNAVSDIKRSAGYHSKTGPNDWKIAGFVGRWIAKQKPVQISAKAPLNLITDGLVELNSYYATVVTQIFLPQPLYPRLFADLRYCYEFRDWSGDQISLWLEHALELSPRDFKPFTPE